MTIKQQQCLLTYLGYDPGVIDGIGGPRTQAALAAFRAEYGCGQEGLVGAIAGTVAKLQRPAAAPSAPPAAAGGAQKYLRSDGYYYIPRGVNVQLSEHLWSSEVMCCGVSCCTESKINKRMVDLFEEIRIDYDAPIQIATAGGSGFRCPIHNVDPDVGGAPGSLHLDGSAFDMHANVAKLLPVVQRHLKDGEYGVYSNFIHVGVWQRGYINRYR